MIKKMSHLAVVVRNVEETGKFYSAAFGAKVSDPTVIQDTKVSSVEVGNTMIELFEPLGDKSIFANFLHKRGEGLHHVCFEVADLDSAIDSLKVQGVEIIGTPSQGMEGRIVFLHPKTTYGLLIELMQKQEPSMK
jgi:methylmalonyl-CoA/ethylmalonyl-CoA epimerase